MIIKHSPSWNGTFVALHGQWCLVWDVGSFTIYHDALCDQDDEMTGCESVLSGALELARSAQL